jgi:diaminopimelate epimerase
LIPSSSSGKATFSMALSVGNPHLVFFVEDGERIPLDGLGPLIEHDPAFPDRINVNVAVVGGDGIRLRTWERGAGLTLACGTGACATAVAAIVSKRAQSPVKVTMPGGSLTISWQPGEPIRMRGAATHVFRGEIDLEAPCLGLGA